MISRPAAGDSFVRCLDGQVRFLPPITEELIRVFRGDDNYMRPKGPIRKFQNGMVIQYLTDDSEPKGNFFESRAMENCVVIRAPDPDKAHMPPYLQGKVVAVNPPRSYVHIVDPTIADFNQAKAAEWIIAWPHFDVKEARIVIIPIFPIVSDLCRCSRIAGRNRGNGS